MMQMEVKYDLKGIKICRISTVSYYLISQLWDQAKYLKEKGMDVMLVSSSGPELSEIKFSQCLRHKTIEIPRSLNLWKDWVALLKLIYIFWVYKFDIVHSTTPKAGLLTSLAAFIARVPIRVHTWTGQRWITLNGPIRYICRLADSVIGFLNTQGYADSKSQRQLLVDEKIVKSERIAVIGNGSLAGVNMDRFNPERCSLSEREKLRKNLGISKDAKILIFIGRITQDKGIAELIAAFLKILSFGYNADLILVGPLDQECGGKRSIDLDLIKQNSRIHYVGYQACPENHLSIADIFCLPSYREGFGTTVIEAAAMGLPTIGTKINGLIDAVDDGKTGILVPARDAQALFESMKILFDNPELIQEMGKAARERCFNLFNANVINEKLVEEYARLLRIYKVKK